MTNTIKDILRESEEEYKTMMADVFKGRLSAIYADDWLKAHDQKLLQAVVDTARGIGTPPRVTEQVTHQTYNDGKRDFLDDLIASITPIE